MAGLGPFKSRAEREKHIVQFVLEQCRSSEHQTLDARRKWAENELLFDGVMNWGQDDEGAQWQSRIFLHEYAPIIREAAIAITETVFQNDSLFNIHANDDADKEFARIREKIIRYYLMAPDQMAFAKKFYDFCLAGAIYGFATFKHPIHKKLYWRPELVIEQIRKQETKSLKGVKASNVGGTILMPSGEEIEEGLEAALNQLLGEPEGEYSRPSPQAKKVLELCMDLKLVNPFNFFFDPDATDINESSWNAERSFPKFHELLPLFEAGVLDSKKKDKMHTTSGIIPSSTAGEYSSFESQKYRQRKQYNELNSATKVCELIEYFGPILTPDGKDILVENAHIIVGNGKYLLKDDTNGYWTQKSPYRTAVFNKRPFKPDGVGIADGAVPQQRILNELFSLFVDALKIDVYSPMGVNVDKLLDPSSLDSGIRPGEIIQITGDGRAEDAFSELPTKSNIFPQLFQTVEFLKLSAQKSSSINTMSSNPASRSRITGAEINSNEGRRNMTINSLASDLDSTCIEPIVRAVDSMVLQFGFTQDNLKLLGAKGVLTPGEYQYVANMTDIERFTEANRHVKVSIKGYRHVMEREREQRATAELMAQMNNLPPQAAQKIAWDKYLPDLIERFGFEPDRWIIQHTPQDKAREENAILILDQMVMVWGQDDDGAHLPSHYDALILNGPVPSLINHIMMHIQRLQQFGKPVPPPPPEAAPFLGMAQPMAPGADQPIQ